MAELVDALDLGSSGVTRESSSLSFRTRIDLFDIGHSLHIHTITTTDESFRLKPKLHEEIRHASFC